MNKLMAFFMFTFICGTIISFSMEGGSGIAGTTVSAAIDDSQTTIPVTSVNGFLPGGDRLTIEKENILYGSLQATGVYLAYTCPCIKDVVRGADDYTGEDTKPASHGGPTTGLPGSGTPSKKGTKVFNRGSSIVNQAIGFNIGEASSTLGKFTTGLKVPGALIKLVIKLVAWDFAFLEGNYVYFKYMFLYPISAGFVWTVISMGGGMAMSILKR